MCKMTASSFGVTLNKCEPSLEEVRIKLSEHKLIFHLIFK